MLLKSNKIQNNVLEIQEELTNCQAIVATVSYWIEFMCIQLIQIVMWFIAMKLKQTFI